MDFAATCEYVNEKLNGLLLSEKVILFRDIFRFPVDYKDGKYFYCGEDCSDIVIKDFLEINSTWMKVSEFDRLYIYFSKLSEK